MGILENINDLLFELTTNEKCVGDVSAELYKLFNSRNSFIESGFHPMHFKQPLHNEECITVNEVGQNGNATYKILPSGMGLFLGDETNETYNCKVIAWKPLNN